MCREGWDENGEEDFDNEVGKDDDGKVECPKASTVEKFSIGVKALGEFKGLN
jgi:hypothetical protein